MKPLGSTSSSPAVPRGKDALLKSLSDRNVKVMYKACIPSYSLTLLRVKSGTEMHCNDLQSIMMTHEIVPMSESPFPMSTMTSSSIRGYLLMCFTCMKGKENASQWRTPGLVRAGGFLMKSIGFDPETWTSSEPLPRSSRPANTLRKPIVYFDQFMPT